MNEKLQDVNDKDTCTRYVCCNVDRCKYIKKNLYVTNKIHKAGLDTYFSPYCWDDANPLNFFLISNLISWVQSYLRAGSYTDDDTVCVYEHTSAPLRVSSACVMPQGGMAYLNNPQKTDSTAFQLAGKK